MYTNRVNVFHITYSNTVSIGITHYFVLDFLPACDTTFYQHFSDTAQTKTIGADIVQFFFVMCDTAAASSQNASRG